MLRTLIRCAMLIAAGLSLGRAAWGEGDQPAAGPDSEQLFKTLDKNGDGQLSRDEVTDEQRRFFERMVRVGDRNGDGKLTAEEFRAAAKPDDRPVEPPRGGEGAPEARPNPEMLFQRLDANRDGKLTKSEVPEGMKRLLDPLFERLGKEELTKEEVIRALQRLAAMARGGGQRPEELFKQMDTNGDGKVTLDEVPMRARPIVEKLLQAVGKGRDDSISKEEFTRAASRFQGEGRPGDSRFPGGRPDSEQMERKGAGDSRNGSGRPASERPAGDQRPPGARPAEIGRRPALPRFFEKIDTNRDGRISAEELAKANELFKDLDENGDGQLDPRELLGPPPADRGGRRPEMEDEREGRDRRPDGRPDSGPDARTDARDRNPARPQPVGRFGAGGLAPLLLTRFDLNGDRKLSLEEAPERLRERFLRLDKNQDGLIEQAELPAAGAPSGRRPVSGKRGRATRLGRIG